MSKRKLTEKNIQKLKNVKMLSVFIRRIFSDLLKTHNKPINIGKYKAKKIFMKKYNILTKIIK